MPRRWPLRSRPSSTTPSVGPGTARPGVRAPRSCSAGVLPRWPRRRRTRRPFVLTVDFDRLGLLPGDRALDVGCGAGRHAFEMYRRGADVIAFDQDADELAKVSDMFAEMRKADEVTAGADADVKEGDA